jgi:hypothetical protein
LSASAEAIVTAGSKPERFTEFGARAVKGRLLIITLALLIVAGFALRVTGLSAEALSEDEFNKLSAVMDYRANGLTGANGEHPLLMKALQTASLFAAEKWNSTSFVTAPASRLSIPVEAALRFPSVLFGTLTVLLIYLLTAELFGSEVALIAAALWAFDPNAVAFNRIAKEDTFLLFFFLLASVFWLRSQRLAEAGRERPLYYWATAASCGAMMASKYVPQYFAILIAYYHIFQGVPAARWRLGKPRFLLFFAIMGATFLLCNPTILLPETWRQMTAFVSYKRIGHDGFEFMGTIYSHKLMDWLKGVPWYFYFVFVAVKIPPLVLASFLMGLPLLLRRRLGDGRFFLFFWTLLGLGPYIFVGGKFTRYFAPMLPVVLITASLGVQFASRLIARHLIALLRSDEWKGHVRMVLVCVVVLSSLWASLSFAPHYRLYTNALGGGRARAGYYFPQDDFYDAYLREVMRGIAERAAPGARVASETPTLTAYYAQQVGRPDLVCVLLSDPLALKELSAGDLIIAARGRRYFSNDALLSRLRQTATPAFRVSLDGVPAAEVYILDQASLSIIEERLRLP